MPRPRAISSISSIDPPASSDGSPIESEQRPTTPLDIVRRVAHYLNEDCAGGTLASLAMGDKGTYEVLMPILYARVIINGQKSDELFGYGSRGLSPGADTNLEQDGKYQVERNSEALHGPSTDEAVSVVREEESTGLSISTTRRLWLFSLVRSISIRSFPSGDTSAFFQSLFGAHTPSAPGQTTTYPSIDHPSPTSSSIPLDLFPNLRTITLEPPATDQIRTYQPRSYDIPHSPPFLEILARCSSPHTLAIHFPTAPSGLWEEHAAETSSGSYNFVSRLNQLHLNDWDVRLGEDEGGVGWTGSVRRFEVFGAVHQVLPSLVGVENVYHFASHHTHHQSDNDRPHKDTTPGRARTDGTGLERAMGESKLDGPHWSYRAWQCFTAIKNVYAATRARERSRSRCSSRTSSRTSSPASARSMSRCRGGSEGPKPRISPDEREMQRGERDRLERTTWRFVNLTGHLRHSGEDDEGASDVRKGNGSEVDMLIRNNVALCVGRDIAGVRGDEVDDILRRIRWD